LRAGLAKRCTLCLFVLGVAPASAEVSADGVWEDAGEARVDLEPAADRPMPQAYRVLSLDTTALQVLLQTAVLEASANAARSDVRVSLPLPAGGFLSFRILESPIMDSELGRRFPEIKTYRGIGIDDAGASVRFDVTPHGFHAMIRSAAGTVFIDPLRRDPSTLYMSYYRRDYSSPDRPGFQCEVHRAPRPPGQELPRAAAAEASGSELRTYRTVVAATVEYTTFHGGTVALGLAAIVVAMNRVNGIYETEVAVRMTLVANNDEVVFTSEDDGYTNSNGPKMLLENQTKLDSVIGSENYDVGHVFSTGGGGVAFLGVVCLDGSKAGGVTGLLSPVGDPFYVDYVAHEMGHQFAGNHTFNGNLGSCAGGNRHASTAYEPGSGSTIQAYAGICGSQNLQSNSDPFFHSASYDEIRSYITDAGAGNGGSCPVVTATGNDPPAVDAGLDHTIPAFTPFVLTGSATDPDSHPLTYSWEERDLGPAGLTDDDGSRPIFRSFPPTTSPSRTLPRLEDVLDGSLTIGEGVPMTTRTLNFRLTVRDGQPGGGGVDFDSIVISTDAGAGPFEVTSQTTAVTWTEGTETVTWDVANTDQAPIFCADVDITLSTDGGLTYPIVLATSTPNDGAKTVTVPVATTSSARVRVQCSDNIFFNVSEVDFSIEPPDPSAIFADGFESGGTSAWSKTVP